MELNTPRPDSLNDGTFLATLTAYYQIEHPKENPITAFAQMLGKTEQHIRNCIANISHLGIEEWTKLVASSGIIAQAQFKRYLIICENRANKGKTKE